MLPQVQGISLDETWPWPQSWDITQQTPRGYLEKNSYGWYETWPHLVCVILSAGKLFDPYYIFMLNMINLTGKTCDTKQLNGEHNLSTLKKQSNTHPKTTCIFQHKHDITLESLENQIRYPSCARKKVPHTKAPGPQGVRTTPDCHRTNSPHALV